MFPEQPWTWRAVRKGLKLLTKGLWMVFDMIGWHPESRALSPYVVLVGRRSEDGAPPPAASATARSGA